MLALLVCAAPVPGSPELVARLAVTADLVIAVDGGGAVCREAGVTPGVLLGDFDSLDSLSVDEFASEGVRIHRFPAEKDATDLELALGEARRMGADQVVVTAALAGRLDHTLGTLGALAAVPALRPRFTEPEMNGWVLHEEGRRELSLTGRGATLSIIPFGGAATVSVTGVRWPLQLADISPESTLGISNRITAAEGARVTVYRGTVAVISATVDAPPAREAL